MSRILNIFVDDTAELRKLVDILESSLSIPLRETASHDGVRFSGSILGISVTLFKDHGLVNDKGIAFEDYPIEIDLDISLLLRKDPNHISFAACLAQFVASRICEELGARTIVVDDLQTLIAAFPAD